MKFSMTEQEKGDILIQVAAWASGWFNCIYVFECNTVKPALVTTSIKLQSNLL